MNDKPLFEGMDEFEETYAPQQLPTDDEAQQRVRLDGDADDDTSALIEPPAAAPVANMGNAPSAAMAPPNIGHEDHGGAPGDPQTQARDPFETDDISEDRL